MRDIDFEFRTDMRTAKKLCSAVHKATFNKLTPAETSAVEDLVCELLMQCGAPKKGTRA